ncbi:MAG: hypothetical protein V1820_06700 [archaeon]
MEMKKGNGRSPPCAAFVLATVLMLIVISPAFPSSSISPYRGSFNVTIGKPFEIPMVVANLGDSEDQFTFTVSGTGAQYSTLPSVSAPIPAKSYKDLTLFVLLPKSANESEYFVEVVAKRAGAFSSSGGSAGGVGIETSVSAVYRLFPAKVAAPAKTGFLFFGQISPFLVIILLAVVTGLVVALLLLKRV